MNDHPNKHIREAVEYALMRGWRLVKSGPRAHSWGRLYCPGQARGCCIISVYGTPRVPENHADYIRRLVDACSHRTMEVRAMKTYEFDVILQSDGEPTDDLADGLYESGCDDGTLASRDGVIWMHFHREAPSLEEAIRTAIAQIRAAGLAVAKIELDAAAAESAVRL